MATSRLSTRRVEWRVQVGTSNKAAQGLVIFEASVSYIPDPLAAGGPRTAIPEPVAAVLDAGGYACTPDAANPAKAGERGAELFTTDSLGEDGGDWTWTARPQLRSVNGIQMADAVPAFSFAVPTGEGSLDLAKVQKVPASPGLGTEAAVALVARAEKAAQDAKNVVGETVAGAAETAVANEIAAADLVRSDNPRLPKPGDPEAFRVQNKDGGVPFRVDKDSTWIGNTEVAPDDERFRIKSLNDRLLLDIDPVTGRVYIPNLSADTLALRGGTSVNRVVVVVIAGQSNGEGRSLPYGPELDPVDERISMYEWKTRTLKPAAVPLSMQVQVGGLSPATVIARQILLKEPPGTHVTILNAAVGGAGLVAATSSGCWSVDYAGTQPRLYSIMLPRLRETMTMVGETFPGLPVDVRFFWHQGESDVNTPPADYLAAFDALVAGVRAELALPDMTVTLGGVVPRGTSIPAVHKQIPARMLRSAYADGIPNGGGSSSVTDTIHYHREGMERMGEAMYAAWRRAVANTAKSIPAPPLTVTGRRMHDGTVRADWSIPLCRVTGYVPQYSAAGGPWTAMPVPVPALDPSSSVTLPSGHVRVRVATVNENGTSTFTDPVEVGTN